MKRRRGIVDWSRRGLGAGRGQRARRAMLGALLLIGVVWLATLLAGLYADWLWFASLGYSGVYARRLTAQVVAFLGGAGLFAAFYLGSLRLAQRLTDGSVRGTVREEDLWAYLARVSAGLSPDVGRAARARRVLLWLGAPLVVLFGLAASRSWELWLLALNQVPFGRTEPLFGRDAAFYVFTLPLLRALHSWAFAATLVVGVATLALYWSWGWLELRLPPRHAVLELTRAARLHLATLAAGFFLLVAAHHQLSLAEQVFASSGQAFRLRFPGYVAAYGQVPALWLMTVAALVAALLLLRAARSVNRRRWLVGPLLWLVAVGAGLLYPLVLEALVVRPNEAVVERPFLARVAALTRFAYGLENLQERPVTAVEPLRPEIALAHLGTLANARLWEPEPLRLGLVQLQAFKPYYGFFLYPDLDRYQIDGQTRAVLVAARELDPRALPAQTWVTTRLQFTHGYGLVAAAAGAVGPDGRPTLVEQGIPPEGPLSLERPEIYFGERTTEPAIVRTSEAEVDYPRDEQNVPTRYQGSAGVALGNPLARLAHAIRLGDPNLLLSPAINADSVVLYYRQIAERVARIAPFLLLDADSYPVVASGRIVWLLDGYTASSSFPLTPPAAARLLAADPRPGWTREVAPNYLRGAVKATVDAYDGTVNFYLADPEDPIAQTYARVYPELFQPLETMPPELRAHLRYPQQLFTVQADMLARFHTSDPAKLYSGEDAWLVARGRLEMRPDARPSYALQRLPGEPTEELALTIPFRPYSQANDRHNLVALLAARSDPPHYGELLLYTYPRDRPVEGPYQAELRIDQDPTVSTQLGLWQRSGAQLIRGDIQTLPLGQSVLYFEPIYLQRVERAALPELQRVVVVADGRVVMEPNLSAALASLLGIPIDLAQPGAAQPTSAPPLPSARELILSAQEHLQRAQEALLAGDRARHDQELQAAQADLQRLAETVR